MFEYETGIVLGSIAAVIVTILMYIKILPRSRDGFLETDFQQFLHDYFHFKKLYLEEVLKFIFTLATVSCVCVGAFLLISYDESWGWYSTSKESTFLYGLLLIVGGPIALRLTYEGLMMFILLVKNVMEINNKLQAPAPQAEPAPKPIVPAPKPIVPAPQAQPAPAPAPATTTAAEETPAAKAPAGVNLENPPEKVACPKCGATQFAGSAFCWKCGSAMK